MIQLSKKFKIRSSDKYMAFRVVLGLIGHSETVSDRKGKHWYSVYPDDLRKTSTLEEALRVWRWEPTVVGGDIVDISFTGRLLGDEDILFATIAPFVQSGSHVSCLVNGRNYTWWFESGRCRKSVQ